MRTTFSFTVALATFGHALVHGESGGRHEQAGNITVVGTGGFTCELSFNGKTMPCSLGRNSVTSNKTEGDGCTPSGSFLLREVFYRPDRVPPPQTNLTSVSSLRPSDGWCDDVSSTYYNKHVTLPFPDSHENLWETGGETYYDLFAVSFVKL